MLRIVPIPLLAGLLAAAITVLAPAPMPGLSGVAEAATNLNSSRSNRAVNLNSSKSNRAAKPKKAKR
ncbi:MAG TPA: hypothetical protein VF601_23650 [Beijerinckiaceae bacterium]